MTVATDSLSKNAARPLAPLPPEGWGGGLGGWRGCSTEAPRLAPIPASLLLGALALTVLGCAAPGAPARPADYPSHAAQTFATVHWRLDRQDGAVTATGVLDVTQPDKIVAMLVELQGLDATGRVVSRAFDQARPRSFTGEEPWPFTIRTAAPAQADRFTVRVADVTFKVSRTGGR